MRHVIFLPTVLDGEQLYRFTYEGTSKEWTYQYELRTTEDGYDAMVTIATRHGIARLKRNDLRNILVETTRAMRDLTNERSEWEHDRTSATQACVRMRLPATGPPDFGEVAGRVIHDLPRLLEATITAYYGGS